MRRRGALDQTHKCLNKQHGQVFLSFALFQQKTHCDRHQDYNHLALRPASPSSTPKILIMDEIHLYVAIIVPNCFFEGE